MEPINERIDRIWCASDMIEIRTTVSRKSLRDRGHSIPMAASDFADALERHTPLEFRDELERVLRVRGRIRERARIKSYCGGN